MESNSDQVAANEATTRGTPFTFSPAGTNVRPWGEDLASVTATKESAAHRPTSESEASAAAADASLRNLFAHHPPTGEQAARYMAVRAACLEAARAVVRLVPDGDFRRRAVARLHESMMLANAGIATGV